MKTDTFWQFNSSYWFDQLRSNEKGLSTAEAEQRWKTNGGDAEKKSAFSKDMGLFLRQFKSPLMLLLLGAVAISGMLGDTSDVFIILFIVLTTGLLSFFQERNAGKVVEKLQSLIAGKTDVMRDGLAKEIPSEAIVPGDIILLKAGDMITADCLVIEANELHANESSLTGESYPVRKEAGVVDAQTALSKRTNCLWRGTNIVSGNARALVIRTGRDTVLGNIAAGASDSFETSFEKGVKEFGFFLMKITLALAIFILVVNLFGHKGIIESALFALALAVGMAPELLPAVTTIAMAAGAKRLLAKKVIVKKLNAIQNLGEVDLLCTDKTGTITEGAIKVAGVVDGKGSDSSFVQQLAWWNASLESGYSNPIDDALKQLPADTSLQTQKTAEVPYDFIRKRLSIAISNEQGKLLICKGAFLQIAAICTRVRWNDGSIEDISASREALTEKFTGYGQDGFRVIGVCYTEIGNDPVSAASETDMIFAGFVLLNDPVKTGIIQTIKDLQQLKVGLKIITGDNRNVAACIAKQIGINEPVILTGAEILDKSPEALKELAAGTHIFAEVEPQQKENVILALKLNFTVAYMGDGINDVSALNAADTGISVDNAVDVAREAADFVLMEKDLAVLVDGIREGRKTFNNTLKYIFINTGSTFGNMFSVAIASLMLPFLPMLPKQILLTNFITDFPYLSVASDNVDEEQLAQPGKWNLSFIRSYMIIFGIHSSLFDVITFVTLFYVLKVKESVFQTGWFIESVLTELFILFIIRTHKSFLKSRPGKYLFLLSVIGLVLTLGLPYLPFSDSIGLRPLPFSILGSMLAIVAAYIITADILKVWFFKRRLSTTN